MATPVYILLVLTKDGLARYRTSSKKVGPSPRVRLGLTEALVDLLNNGLRKHGFMTVEVGTVELGRLGWHAGRTSGTVCGPHGSGAPRTGAFHRRA